MKKTGIIFIMAIVITGLIFSDAALAGQCLKRQANQQKRICQGVAIGELTRSEIGRLEREQRDIQKQKRKAWSDGILMPCERICLERNQDYASGHIYRLKHNKIGQNR